MDSIESYFLPKLNIVMGVGALEQAGGRIGALGKHALLVCGQGSMRKIGAIERLEKSLKRQAMEVTVYDGVMPNPTKDAVDGGAALSLRKGCDLIIGLGGGSAIDTAKAIAIAAGHGRHARRSIWDFAPTASEPAPITAATLPIVAITTTSGSGSHVTKFAVISNPALNQKVGVMSEHIIPVLSIIDLDLLKGMSSDITAVCGVDVFAHCLEGFVSKQANPLSDVLALAGIGLVARHLPAVCGNGGGIEGRRAMAVADTCAGIVLSSSRLILPHAMSHPVGAFHPQLAHGKILAALTPVVIRHLIEKGDEMAKRKMVTAAETMSTAMRRDGGKSDLAEAVRELLVKVGLATGLRNLGVAEADIPLMADTVIKTGKGALAAHPIGVDRDDIAGLYSAALA